nr:MAG TPA: Terminase small subunit [Caudoviricetes sp.]
MKLTLKQQRFADEYIISGNATEAAIKAGYSKKTANVIGVENLIKPNIKTYVDEKLKELSDKKIADQQEVLAYLTSVLRGETQSEIVVVEGQGEGVSRAKPMQKAPDEKERLKAAELLGKRMGLFKERVELSTDEPSKKLSDILDQLGGEGLEE